MEPFIENNKNIIYGNQNFTLPSHLNYGSFVLDNILKHPERIALVNGDTDVKITYGELAQEIVNIATSLREFGITRGDVLGICSENRTEFLTTTIAALCVGAIVTYINSAYCKDELIHTINISKPKYMFLSPDTFKLYHKAMLNLNIDKFIVYGTNLFDDEVTYYRDFATTNISMNHFKTIEYEDAVPTALILYSSGTTGLPKGAKLSHRNLIIAGIQPLAFNRDLICLSVAPWSNTVGIICMMDEIINNQTVVYIKKFNEELYLKCIDNYKVQFLLAVPPLIVILNKSPLLKNYNVNSVEFIYCGGATLNISVINEAKERFPNLKILLQGYGMTEATGAVTEDSENSPREGSVGKVVAGNIVKVVDIEKRHTLGPNSPGELCFKGPVLFEGYIGKEIGEELDDDAFYKSGDVAYYDEEGYFYIVDRLKEIIKYKAHQVAPSEIEAVLLKHPSVKDVGVISTPDPMAGELPIAFVVKNPGIFVTEKELVDFVASNVSPWKKLRGGVRFVDVIPKTGSGKILRRMLRDMLNP